MPLSRLVYVSQTTLAPDEVGALAAASAIGNARLGITGALLFVDAGFLQVLEGSAEAIERLFERICCDFRHTEVKLIDLVPATERLFPDCAMACLTADQDIDFERHGELAGIRHLARNDARKAVCLLRKLVAAGVPAAASS